MPSGTAVALIPDFTCSGELSLQMVFPSPLTGMRWSKHHISYTQNMHRLIMSHTPQAPGRHNSCLLSGALPGKASVKKAPGSLAVWGYHIGTCCCESGAPACNSAFFYSSPWSNDSGNHLYSRIMGFTMFFHTFLFMWSVCSQWLTWLRVHWMISRAPSVLGTLWSHIHLHTSNLDSSYCTSFWEWCSASVHGNGLFHMRLLCV